MDNIAYHLTELEIAKSDNDERYILPNLTEADQVILDIGCGLGQTFIALNCLDRHCIGIDIDDDAIEYGKRSYGDRIEFHLSDAHQLPVDRESIDLVICRVSLPYTNIPQVINQISRALKPNGKLWLTTHKKSMAIKYFKEAWQKNSSWKRKLHVSYILLNGYFFKYFGSLLPYLNGHYESWQDELRMHILLNQAGFESESSSKNGIEYITARKL